VNGRLIPAAALAVAAYARTYLFCGCDHDPSHCGVGIYAATAISKNAVQTASRFGLRSEGRSQE